MSGDGRGVSSQAAANMERYALLREQGQLRAKQVAVATLKEDACHYFENIRREMRNQKEVVLAAIESEKPPECADLISDHNWSIDSPPFIPRSLQEDRDVMLALVGLEDFDMDEDDIPESLRSDKEVMIAVCSKVPEALRVASEELRDDQDVVFAALAHKSKGASCFEYLSHGLRENKDVILKFFALHKTWNDDVASAFCDHVDQNSSLRKDSEVALALLSCGKPTWDFRDILLEFSENVRANKKVIEKAVSLEGFMLQDAADAFKADKDLVTLACKTDGRALQFAATKLKRDMEVIKIACHNHGEALSFIDDWDIYDKVASEPEFMRQVIRNKGGSQIFVAPKELQEDEDLVLEAIKNGCNLGNIPLICMKSDKEFLIKALAINPELYNELRRTTRMDPDIIKAALLGGYISCDDCRHSMTIWRRFRDLFKDPEIFLWMVENGEHEYYEAWNLPDALRGDKEFMTKICRHDGNLIQYGASHIQEDLEVVNTAVQNCPQSISSLPTSFLETQPTLLLDYLARVEEPFEIDQRILRSDRRVALAYAAKQGSLEDDLDEFDDDPEIVLAVIARDPEEIEAASNSLKDEKQFLLSAVRKSGMALEYVSDEFQADFNLRVAAIANNGKVVDMLQEEYSEESVWKLAKTIRGKLQLYDHFMGLFLCAMDARPSEVQCRHIVPTGQYPNVSLSVLVHLVVETPVIGMFFGGFAGLHRLAKKPASKSIEPTGYGCSLSMLSMGDETSVALKRLIADYVGVPTGDELKELKLASENLSRRGF